MIYPTQLSHIDMALRQIVRFDHPADAILSNYFREQAALGAQDRHLITDTIFACLRRYMLVTTLIQPEKITPRRLALVTLTRICQINLSELTRCISTQEHEWLVAILDKPIVDTLALQAELPEWIIDSLSDQTAQEIIALGQAMMGVAPLDLRVNTLKMKREPVLARLHADNIGAVATGFSPVGIRLTGKPSIKRHPFFSQGIIEVQDEGSQLLGLITGAKRGEIVVDFCAGAGGKSLVLGGQMASTGRLYAWDISEQRLASLKPRLLRSGLSNIHPQQIAHENDAKVKRLTSKADRVLVDAPCSGLGTLRRHPDLKFRQDPNRIAQLNVKQASILHCASQLVKPGGRLVYATCSMLPQENQHIVTAFLAQHPDFAMLPMSEVLANANLPMALDTGDYLELKPHRHHTDGFFAAALVRHR